LRRNLPSRTLLVFQDREVALNNTMSLEGFWSAHPSWALGTVVQVLMRKVEKKQV
jgi:hypothetical protein